MDVSRETQDKLQQLAELVRKWNPQINLVSSATLGSLDERHIADSAQLAPLVQNPRVWADLGSGGGFPGLVVSILRPATEVILIESDTRKAVFLRNVVRSLSLNARVIPTRIDAADPVGADVVSARALAPLPRLVPMAIRHGHEESTYVFPKGASHQSEIKDAARYWKFEIDVHPSTVDKDGAILLMRNIERV